jgi:archaeal flagellar protein FlaF
MGFETSVVVIIFFVSVLITGTISYTTISSSHDLLSSSADEHYSTMNKKLQTDLQIVDSNAIIHNSTYQLSLQILNTGSETLRSDEVNVLIDGVYRPCSTLNTTTTWTPETCTILNVYDLSGFGDHRVKVVAENGICDYYTYNI